VRTYLPNYLKATGTPLPFLTWDYPSDNLGFQESWPQARGLSSLVGLWPITRVGVCRGQDKKSTAEPQGYRLRKS